jgi:hypothetical protein
MERTALIHFLNFWIHEGDLPLRTRVFAITIGQIFAHPMDIAATVVLNRCPSKKMFSNLFLHFAVLFLHGFMYFPSQPQHPPVTQQRAVRYDNANNDNGGGVDRTGGGGAARWSKQH